MTSFRRLVAREVVLAVVLVAARSFPASAQTPSGAATVEVTGRGASIWEARNDAIQQALQLTVRQLVVADRAVVGDELVKDNVLSTMNGFVERFEILSQTLREGTWALHSRVTVSASAMLQYASRPIAGGGATVDGNTILGNVAASRMRLQRNRELYLRLLEGFPFQAYDVEVVDIKPDINAETVVVEAEMSLNAGFIQQLNAAMQAVASANSGWLLTWKRRPFCRTYSCDMTWELKAPAHQENGVDLQEGGVKLLAVAEDHTTTKGYGLAMEVGILDLTEWIQLPSPRSLPVLFVTETSELRAGAAFTGWWRYRDWPEGEDDPHEGQCAYTEKGRNNTDNQEWWTVQDDYYGGAIILTRNPVRCTFTLAAEFFEGASTLTASVAQPGMPPA